MLPDRHGGDLADIFEPRRRPPSGIFEMKTDLDDAATSRPLPLRLGTICEQCWVQSGLVNTVGDFFCPHGGEQ